MLLLTCATSAEADALRQGLAAAGLDPRRTPVTVTGIGRGATAFAYARALMQRPTGVVQVGIGGAYPAAGLAVGAVAVATQDTYADLGADDDGRLLSVADLGLHLLPGFPGQTFPADPALSAMFAGVQGPFLTVETATGSAANAARLVDRWGPALVESMEGAAGAHACALDGVPFAQVRAISNLVGPRDRAAWAVREALAAVVDVVVAGVRKLIT